MLGVNTKLLILFIVLVAMLVLFVWNRWRYDIVALVALLVVAVAGLVPPSQVFAGFGHPAVITVAAVLVLSRGLLNAGVVDSLARQLTRVGNQPMIQVATLTGIVALCSGFMNNVGALALLMPVAIWMSRRGGRSPSFLLMPLAFGSLFGGTLTLIGTPPNIIIAAYREQSGALPFGMFDFIPVGAAITMCGLFFISIIGWRLTPQRKEQDSAEDLFEISSYLTELIVPEGCKFAGRTLYDLIAAVRNDADVVVIGLVRTGRRQQMPSTYEVIKENDILLVEADSDSLKTLIDVTGLKLAEASGNEDKEKAREGGPNLVEATVAPGSMLAGKTARSLDLRERYGINVLAVARQGRRLRERLGKIRFVTGDILLIQGREESLPSTLNDLGCLPLASRGLRIGKPRNVLLAICIFAVSLALIACKLLPAATALAGGAAAMVLAGLISPGEIYKSIDMSIILLLAAMLPIGHALESTGGSQLIAYKLLAVGRSASPAMTLVILMTATMLLSNLVNNAAAAILAAPIAINLAKGMELSVDPFLMAVA